jgi:hypothetical protein
VGAGFSGGFIGGGITSTFTTSTAGTASNGSGYAQAQTSGYAGGNVSGYGAACTEPDVPRRQMRRSHAANKNAWRTSGSAMRNVSACERRRDQRGAAQERRTISSPLPCRKLCVPAGDSFPTG